MQAPENYYNIRNIVSDTIFRYDASDIIEVLTSTSDMIGPIIPADHCKSLELKDAIKYIQENKDNDLLDELHEVFEEYFNNIIDSFLNLPVDNEEYFGFNEFDKDYLWIEKNYLIMFGLWSPRILHLYVSDNIEGGKILYHDHEGQRYTFCPMFNDEINMVKCKACPFFGIKKDNPNSLMYKDRGKKYFCKYLEFTGDDYDEF